MSGLFDSLRVGEADRSGTKVTSIIGRTTGVAVYFTEGDHLKVDSAGDAPTPRELEILKAFDRLHAFIGVALKKDKALPLKHDLGSAVFRALADQRATCPVTDYFSDVDEHIHTRALDIARFVYVMSGFVVALAALLILLIIYISPWTNSGSIRAIMLGAAGGIIGSALSIFMRSNTLEISPYKQHSFSAFQGASRIALGALFGFIFICCVKANILLGVLSDKPPGLFAFSILAGFSETFVPELLKRMEVDSRKSASTPSRSSATTHN